MIVAGAQDEVSPTTQTADPVVVREGLLRLGRRSGLEVGDLQDALGAQTVFVAQELLEGRADQVTEEDELEGLGLEVVLVGAGLGEETSEEAGQSLGTDLGRD